jgi:hypothetical protein
MACCGLCSGAYLPVFPSFPAQNRTFSRLPAKKNPPSYLPSLPGKKAFSRLPSNKNLSSRLPVLPGEKILPKLIV